MATYPTLTHNPSQNSEESPVDDLQLDRASNGSVRGRALFTAAKRRFSVVHEGTTAAEKATLLGFYAANRTVSFTFVWAGDGATYTCYFAAPPSLKIAPGLRWTVTMSLAEA